MTKQETQIMKGVAILMMLILHLFGKTTEGYVSLIHIGNEPIEYILRSAVNPVSFFLILSGYGMHFVCAKGKDKNKWNRVRKIYIHWWAALAIFSVMGGVLGIREYYTDIISVISNYTGYDCNWNFEGWFMFPYMLLMLICPWIFKVTDRGKSIYVAIFVIFLGFCCGFITSRYRDVLHWLVYNPIYTVVSLSPSFILGSILHKEQIIGKIQEKKPNPWGIWVTLISLVTIVCIVGSAALNNVYAFLFVILFLAVPRWNFVDSMLSYFGKHSMNIWFTHTWFSNYLFHKEIYSLQYSILIFLTVLLLSIVSSYIIDYICNAIEYGTSQLKKLFIKQ